MDLLATGGITFDNLFWVDRLPEKHFEGIIRKSGTYFGGRAPNVAVGAARLGVQSGIVSAVGEDFEIKGYGKYLEGLGIDLHGVVVVPKSKTKEIFIFTDLHGRQISFFDFGAERYFEKMNVPTDLIRTSKLVHITSSGDFRFNVRCAKIAFENDVPVSFDPGNDPSIDNPEYLKDMLRISHFLFMNEIEAHRIMKSLKLTNIGAFLSLGPKILGIINKENKSSYVYTQSAVEKIPSAISITRDPTGASDGYVAAFLTGHLKGYDLRTCGRLGAIEASFVAESFGSQTNLPSWSLLYNRYKKLFGDLPHLH